MYMYMCSTIYEHQGRGGGGGEGLGVYKIESCRLPLSVLESVSELSKCSH